MIPKTIHYCWFGEKSKPKLVEKCIQSWIKYCPDYEIIEWNESNFDVHQNRYTTFCYENRKYAFLSDYVRLKTVYEYGGIYLDTDVEVIRKIDELCNNTAFFGFENNEYVATGLGFGAEKNNIIVGKMMAEYEFNEGEPIEVKKAPALNTAVLEKMGLVKNGETQIVNGAQIYSSDFFNPYDDPTGRLNITKNTYTIHWFAKSWVSKRKVLRSKLTRPLHRLFGVDFFKKKKKRH